MKKVIRRWLFVNFSRFCTVRHYAQPAAGYKAYVTAPGLGAIAFIALDGAVTYDW